MLVSDAGAGSNPRVKHIQDRAPGGITDYHVKSNWLTGVIRSAVFLIKIVSLNTIIFYFLSWRWL